MSLLNVWIHLVFATKSRQPLLKNNIRRDVFQHILKNGREKGIEMDFVNGYYDHCHCLFKLPATIDLATAAKLIKGESSHWINKNQLTVDYFEWQDGYYAESVSPKYVERVRNYIRNQETHHQDIVFETEIETLGFTFMAD